MFAGGHVARILARGAGGIARARNRHRRRAARARAIRRAGILLFAPWQGIRFARTARRARLRDPHHRHPRFRIAVDHVQLERSHDAGPGADGAVHERPSRVLNMLKEYYRLTKPGIVYGNLLTTVAAYLYASHWHIHRVNFFATVVGLGL